MDITKLKQDIIFKIMETNDFDLLSKISELLHFYDITQVTTQVNESAIQYDVNTNEKIIAYKTDGASLNQKQFEEEILSIIEDSGLGNTVAHNEVKSTMDKWVQDRLNGIL